MRVAAYQAPLAATRSAEIVASVREQVYRCEALGVEILCCPEGVLGGLADYTDPPDAFAIDVERGQLDELLAPLASDSVTTIVGFTEIDRTGRLFNAAAVFSRGSMEGVYRKLHPAINQSVYSAGTEMPVFTIGALTFGIIICRDSVFPEPAAAMASRGATALFVPTNNGLPITRASVDIIAEARSCDVARAVENGVSVIRADVAGRTSDLVSYGSSRIVDQDGNLLASARQLEPDLIVADIQVARQPNAALSETSLSS